jgi:glycosyltransferase involved in cell wall biosynthesis
MSKHVHLIAFDVPYPANYGGVIDVFYKVKALADMGVSVHLHCFEYGRPPAKELKSICASVNYYRRHTTRSYLFRRKPYIVVTRSSDALMANLLKNNYPILYEGLHTCLSLDDERLMHRHKVVRTHNIEHEYYRNLADVERNPFKRYYFGNEAEKLKRFERILCNAQAIAAISQADAAYLDKHYPNVHHITAFHPNTEVQCRVGKGEYCLYHGNLDVGENNEAALYLVRKIFNTLKVPLIIAGSKPSAELQSEVAKYAHIELRANGTTEEIHDLVRNAQINVLPTFQATGIKLKLLAALFMGRHCVVNPPMVNKTGLESLCVVEEDDRRFAAAIQRLFATEFTEEAIAKREKILLTQFSNQSSVQSLIALLFP